MDAEKPACFGRWPPQPVRDLIGVDLWMEPSAYAGAPATGRPILPLKAPTSWARIDVHGDARIVCAACGRLVALAEAWLASGRVVCFSYVPRCARGDSIP